MTEFKVGKLIRIIWDEENDSLQIVMDITDPIYKNKILNTRDFKDIINFKGTDVMIVASKSKME